MTTMTISDLMVEYRKHYVRADETYATYTNVICVFQRDNKQQIVSKITVDEVLSWRRLVLDRARETTWNNYMRHMRCLWNLAIKLKKTTENPFKIVGSVREDTQLPKLVSDDSIHKALIYIDSRSDGWLWRTIVETLWYTGMRRRQLVGLKWQDLDFARKEIILRSGTSKNRLEWVIPMSTKLAGPLRALRKATQWAVGNNIDDSQVFNITLFNPNYCGDELSAQQLTAFFARVSKRIGQNVGAHRFRHKIATKIMAESGNSKTVQHLLGHRNPDTTYQYIHPDLSIMRSLLNDLPALR